MTNGQAVLLGVVCCVLTVGITAWFMSLIPRAHVAAAEQPRWYAVTEDLERIDMPYYICFRGAVGGARLSTLSCLRR